MSAIVRFAVEVALMPERIDLSSILSFAGGGALLATGVGALFRFGPDRLNRFVTFGTLCGATFGAVALSALLLFHLEARCFAY